MSTRGWAFRTRARARVRPSITTFLMRLQTPISPQISTVSLDCAWSAAFDWAYSTRKPYGRSSLRHIYPTTHLAPPRSHLHRSSFLTPFSACMELSDLPLPDADPARSVHGDGFSLASVVLCSSRRRRTGRLKPCISAINPATYLLDVQPAALQKRRQRGLQARK